MEQPHKKLSSLIWMALGDLAKCETDEKYMVDMSFYHVPDEDLDKCVVCFAGAVIAMTMSAPRDAVREPSDYPAEWTDALRALDLARRGWMRDAVRELGQPVPDGLRQRAITSYDLHPASFRLDMRRAAEELERHGL